MTGHIIFLSILLSLGTLYAQNGVDTALIKELGVKNMKVYVKIPILNNKTVKDSCLVEEYSWDTSGRLIFDMENLKCYGWDGKTENRHVFNKEGFLALTHQIKNGDNILVKYSYNERKDLIKILQRNEANNDSFVTLNQYFYEDNKVVEQKTMNIYGYDTTIFIMKYAFDTADNVSEINTYDGEGNLMERQTFQITPISKKLLEFSTEVKLPKKHYTKAWNYYDFDARLFKTQYSNNSWTDFFYYENGLLQSAVYYNVDGTLSSIKIHTYEFHDGDQ